MFYVFGINGPMYQGRNHERLSQIASVRGVARPAGLRANASGVESREAQARQAIGQPPSDAPPRPRSPVSAYIGTQQGPQTQRRPLETVADVMTRGALCVAPRMTVEKAWEILTSHRVGQAPVLNDSGHVVGLLLRADVAPPSLTHGPSPQMAQRLVREVMVTPVPAVSEETLLRRLAYVLMDTGLPGLPVTDANGSLSGFVSRTDILRAVAADPPLDLWS